jgi:hypothetical protein
MLLVTGYTIIQSKREKLEPRTSLPERPSVMWLPTFSMTKRPNLSIEQLYAALKDRNDVPPEILKYISSVCSEMHLPAMNAIN